ncbi:MAG: NAD(P)H-hydrate epimerase [Myxococcota bacterium]
MKRVCDAETVRSRDAAVIEGLGIPGRALMEIAGRGAAFALQERFPQGPVAVLCGPGNNGGDGFVVARWLKMWGRDVRLWAPIPAKTMDAKANRDLCDRQQIPTVASLEEAMGGAAVGVDAMLGTGQRSSPRGGLAEGVRALNDARRRGTRIVALDMPTGVHADTGQILDEGVRADLTVTFGHHKQGLWCVPGAIEAGEVVVIDIGLDLAPLADARVGGHETWLLEARDIQAVLPHGSDQDAKWNRGHVAIRANAGAAVLCAHGAFCAGAGLVTLLVPRAEWPRLSGLRPEVIVAEPASLNPTRHDVLVIGPALGTHAAMCEVVREQWSNWPNGLVADADALTALGARALQPPPGRARIITPHAAEAARILGSTRAAVDADRFQAARALRRAGVAILKGPHSLIVDERQIRISPVRCGRLATAGTGDVLAGLIGGLLARGVPAPDAAAGGVWLHAQAGVQMPPRGTASDLVSKLKGLSWIF